MTLMIMYCRSLLFATLLLRFTVYGWLQWDIRRSSTLSRRQANFPCRFLSATRGSDNHDPGDASSPLRRSILHQTLVLIPAVLFWPVTSHAAATAPASSPAGGEVVSSWISPEEATVTQKVFMDVRISRQDGTFYVRDDLPDTPENRVYTGRLVIGLFGKMHLFTSSGSCRTLFRVIILWKMIHCQTMAVHCLRVLIKQQVSCLVVRFLLLRSPRLVETPPFVTGVVSCQPHFGWRRAKVLLHQ